MFRKETICTIDNWTHMINHTTNLEHVIQVASDVMLLDEYVDILIQRVGVTPEKLLSAYKERDTQYIDLVSKYNYDELSLDDEGNKLMHLACRDLDRESVLLMVNKWHNGKQELPVNNNGDTPLHIICKSDDRLDDRRGIINLLVTLFSSSIDKLNNEGLSALHIICSAPNKSTSLLFALLQRHQNVNLRDKNGMTPIYKLCSKEFQDVDTLTRLSAINLLLTRGAKLDSDSNQTENGFTPLHAACECNNTEIVKRLIQVSAPKDAKDKMGRQPVYYAVENNNMDIVKMLF